MNKLALVREAAVFKSNRSQAVRIPKELAFGDEVKRVTIEQTPDGGLIIKPIPNRVKDWETYFRDGPFLTADFDPNIDDPPPADDISFDD